MENLNHFDIISIFSGILWLVFITVFISWFYVAKIKDQRKNILFLPTIYFKITSALSFSFIYLFYYQGGDTFAYWEGATVLNKLFWEAPKEYLWEMLNPSNIFNHRVHFNSSTGYPPSWIYKEPESFFVSKVLSIFTFFTFKSYWATTILIATIGGGISWHFYKIIQRFNLHNENILAFGILFLPSVSFWCFGISKDTIVYFALILLFSHIVLIFRFKAKLHLWRILLILLCVFLIYHIRIYVLVAMAPALTIAFGTNLIRKNNTNKLKKLSIRILLYGLSTIFLILYVQSTSGGGNLDKIVNDLIIIQQDFAYNETYGDNRYIIYLEDYSLTSIILSIPPSILAALYRPYLWESLNPMLILNGIEGFVLFILTLKFFFVSFREKIKIISQNELLTFSLIFILIMGFSVGFTSGLFGVLVRLKAVVLPFFVLLIGMSTTVNPKSDMTS